MNAITVDNLRRVYLAKTGVIRRQTKEVVAIGSAYAVAGYLLFAWMEDEAKRRGTLEAF